LGQLSASGYSGGRDQEDHGSKPAQANSSRYPISKKAHHKKRVGRVAQGVGPEFKSQYHTHTKRTKNKLWAPHIKQAEV
jgi:hypothetical protein